MKKILKLFAVLASGLGVTLGGLTLGYTLYDNVPNTAEYKTYADVPMANTTVGDNTVIKYVYSYSDDGEQLFYEELAPDNLKGLDLEQIKASFADYEVCEFDGDSLVLKKEIDGRSNAHYLISEKDGYVAVYFENGILKEKTATPINSLPTQTKAQIAKGIKITGTDELASCLEDIES